MLSHTGLAPSGPMQTDVRCDPSIDPLESRGMSLFMKQPKAIRQGRETYQEAWLPRNKIIWRRNYSPRSWHIFNAHVEGLCRVGA